MLNAEEDVQVPESHTFIVFSLITKEENEIRHNFIKI